MNAVGQLSANAALLPILDRYAGLRALVVGDVMLDEYIAGAVDRISPEAPVPVVRVTDTERRLGGAANVARQVAALGASVTLAGIVGLDVAGEGLVDLCRLSHVDTTCLLRVADRSTTRKLRVLGHHQQLLRVDWEESHAHSSVLTEQLFHLIERQPRPDVIVLSDYAKGVLSPQLIDALMRLGVRLDTPVVVDPKHRDFRRYRGATTITPNLHELQTAAQTTLDPKNPVAVTAAARRVMDAAELSVMVVTMGECGMLVVPAIGEETSIPAVQRAVYDVTGAGDTAIAVLALSIAAQASFIEAAQIANAAAGLAVGQVGTVAIEASGIRAALSGGSFSKVLSQPELGERAITWRMSGKQIAFTNGCFDLLHSGHLRLLREARKHADVLVLAINSDASIRRLKGAERPLVGQDERAALLAALDCVDAVAVFDEDTPLETIRRVRPQVLVKGGDYRLEDVVGREFVEGIGGRVELVPLVPDRSTSALVKRLRTLG